MANREFRKVKSLNFLYEITKDGRFIRNVCSKKYLYCWKDSSGKYYVDITISNNIYHISIHDLVEEAWTTNYFIQLISINESLYFPTKRAAAAYLANKYKKNHNTIYAKLSKHRHHIYGYDIKYLKTCLNGETGRHHSME